MTQTPKSTGSHALSHRRAPRSLAAARLLLDMIVGRLAGNDDVVHVALAQARAGDAHELRLLLQLGNRSAAQIAHSRLEAADELEDHGLKRPAIRHPALDAFRNELGEAVLI